MSEQYNMKLFLFFLLFCAVLPKVHAIESSWILVDDFESNELSPAWTNVDTQNETDPYVAHAQVTKLVRETTSNKQYLLKMPAAEGIVGNRKAISFRKLPKEIPVGETYTVYSRMMVRSFPNNHSFGLSNLSAFEITKQGYDAFEPMIRVTDKAESDGYKNDGTLMVLSGYKAYSKIVNPMTNMPAKPLDPMIWYEIWSVINNSPNEEGGQKYDLYIRGGEFSEQTLVFSGAVFRIQREESLKYFMAICNTGSKKTPYGNGGLAYDDIYMFAGTQLSSPISN